MMFVLVIAVLVLASAAEWLHIRRTARVSMLAFGKTTLPGWVIAGSALRALSLTGLVWASVVLLRIDGGSAKVREDKQAQPQHLLVALDVSPSMMIKDAGPAGNQRRRERAAAVFSSVLSRLDTRRVRVSVVAFYTTAKPVVVDTSDMNVVNNILADLPLEYAFKEGRTNMYAGVREAAKLARPWKPGSTTLVIISDGDTLPDSTLETLPPSISDCIVLGVGNSFRASPVGDTASKQDSVSLKTLAARLRGEYFDGNTSHLQSSVLGSLSMAAQVDEFGVPLRTAALWTLGISGVLLGTLWPMMAMVRGRLTGKPRRQTGHHPRESSERAAGSTTIIALDQRPAAAGPMIARSPSGTARAKSPVAGATR